MRYIVLIFLVIMLTACGSSDEPAPTLIPTAQLESESVNQSPRIEETATPENLLPPTYTPQPIVVPTIIAPTSTPDVNAENAGISTTSGQQTYIVQEGDTLGLIAEQFGVSLEALITLNNIDDPDVINAGISLLIP
jgi:LysM repeat protein